MSDWGKIACKSITICHDLTRFLGGHHSGVGDALAGLDMSMPGDIAFDSGTS